MTTTALAAAAFAVGIAASGAGTAIAVSIIGTERLVEYWRGPAVACPPAPAASTFDPDEADRLHRQFMTVPPAATHGGRRY